MGVLVWTPFFLIMERNLNDVLGNAFYAQEQEEAKYINWVIGYKMVTYSEIYSREFKKKICNKYFWN